MKDVSLCKECLLNLTLKMSRLRFTSLYYNDYLLCKINHESLLGQNNPY